MEKIGLQKYFNKVNFNFFYKNFIFLSKFKMNRYSHNFEDIIF